MSRVVGWRRWRSPGGCARESRERRAAHPGAQPGATTGGLTRGVERAGGAARVAGSALSGFFIGGYQGLVPDVATTYTLASAKCDDPGTSSPGITWELVTSTVSGPAPSLLIHNLLFNEIPR